MSLENAECSKLDPFSMIIFSVFKGTCNAIGRKDGTCSSSGCDCSEETLRYASIPNDNNDLLVDINIPNLCAINVNINLTFLVPLNWPCAQPKPLAVSSAKLR